MTISVLKMHFRKLPPKIISYRDFKKFDNERFMDSLQHILGQESFDWSKTLISFITFVIQYLTLMGRKRNYIRGNNKPFITKPYSKAIIQRTRFRNKFLKNANDQNKLLYNKQRNFCFSS